MLRHIETNRFSDLYDKIQTDGALETSAAVHYIVFTGRIRQQLQPNQTGHLRHQITIQIDLFVDDGVENGEQSIEIE